MPSSVPAILDVYPEMKWNIVCSTVSFDIGGKTPLASQVRRMIFVGWPSDMQGIFALSMYSIG